MIYLQKNDKKIFVRQLSVSNRYPLYMALVGSLTQLKGFVAKFKGNYDEEYSFYAYDGNRTSYCGQIENSYKQKYHTVYRRIGKEDFYELIMIPEDMYQRLQNLKNNISFNGNTFYFLLRAKDIDINWTTNTGNHVTSLNLYDLSQSEAFQEALYKQISLSCPIPVLPEWIPVLLNNNRGQIFKDLYTYVHCASNPEHCLIAARLTFSADQLSAAITKLFKAGTLSFGNDIKTGAVSDIHRLNAYLDTFGDDLVQRAHNRFNPLYVPGISEPTAKAVKFFTHSHYFGNLNLFGAQKDLISSIALSLDRNKKTIVVGEMGTGKTCISLGAIYTHTQKKNPVVLVMAPGHLVEKWRTEIKRLYPLAQTCIISDIKDVLKWEKAIKENRINAPLFLITGKDTCKMDYETRPYLQWDSRKKRYYDPLGHHAAQVVRRCRSKGTDNYWSHNGNIDWETVTYFAKPGAKNQYILYREPRESLENTLCERNSSNIRDLHSIWTIANPEADSEWVKVPSVGWINKKCARDYVAQCDRLTANNHTLNKDALKVYGIATSALTEEVSHGVRRCNISDYIRRRIPLDYFIADEVHLYSSKDTAQGKAFSNFIHAAKYTIALTGTLLNGYAQNIFFMLFRLYPDTFIRNGFGYSSMTNFAKQYGVIETTEEYANNYYRGEKPKYHSQKFKPGVSPLLFSKFLLDKAVFATLADITADLPNYEEIPVGVEMDLFTKEGYDDFYQRSQELFASNPDDLDKYVFKIVQRMNTYPDQPYNQIPIFNNDTGEQIICPNNISHKNPFYSNKDLKTLDIIRQHLNKKEKILVYVNWVNASDCVSRLEALLKENHIKSAFLTASIDARKREAWIQDQVNSGIDVLICNPSLVETGLDLLDFTTIIFYQLGYNLFTMRQASRRSLRLNQDHDVTVYFMYFKDTVQENILSLMANKLQAAMAIEGKFSEEGLNAMSETDTLLTQLADNLTKNINVKLSDGAFDFHTIKAQRSGNRFKKKTETLMHDWFFPLKYVPKKGKEIINLPQAIKACG